MGNYRSVEKIFLKLLTFLEELYKIKTIKGKKEKREVIQMTKMIETLGALERERERVSLYSTWNLSTRPHTSILNNEIIKFNRGNKAKLIAVFGGRL